MDESPSTPVREGDILAGKYRIERVLGAGGMGVVVAARHLQLDQHVAIKFLLPEAMENPEVVARFAREARAAAKIQSEHVARVIDVGTLETGAPYMVMEYLEGKDLRGVLDEEGPLPVERVAAYVLQACEAIAAAHALGIVHRDLKPANMFLAKRQDRAPIVKVLDFGISKMREPQGEAAVTKTSAMMGSPIYMSPEQMKATKSVDVHSDIWALGVILYELVSNDRPFDGETVAEVIANVLSEDPKPLEQVRPGTPPEFVAIVKKCLEKKPANRYRSVAELALALASFAPATQVMSVERIHQVLGADLPAGTLAGIGPARRSFADAQPATPRPLGPADTELMRPETGNTAAPTQASPAAPAATGASTAAAWTNAQTSAGSGGASWKRPAIVLGSIAAVTVAAVVGILASRGSSGAAAPAATTTTAATSPATTPATTAEPPTLPPVATTATATASASVTASTTPAPTKPPIGVAPPKPTPSPPTTTATPTAATPTTAPAPTPAPPKNPLEINPQ